MDLELLGKQAKAAAAILGKASNDEKNAALLAAAELLEQETATILTANERDLERARQSGMSEGLLDRLALNEVRICGMADGLRQVSRLDNPLGEIVSQVTRPNGLVIQEKRVPFGVIGIIYESRPNVTADAFSLCFKTGNAVILRGGSDAVSSNQAIAAVIRDALESRGFPADCIQLLTDTSRETAARMMQLKEYIDVLIPRGGAGLIQSVIKNSTIPVIETGTGNCHIYVDKDADLDMAVQVVVNAKCQRLGTCNTCESLVVHSSAAPKALPMLVDALDRHSIEIRGDQRTRALCPSIGPASEEDWGKEYLDRIISVKIVDSLEQAIAHINRYNTKHSDAIITENTAHAQQFLDEVDAAAVYVNASTRFTDGFEFGFGAEIGISTQKLHARGPMGLKALTTKKYMIYGTGQIRS